MITPTACNKDCKLEDTNIGEAYVRTEKFGPFVRYSTTQENFYEDGLIHWMKKTSPEDIAKSEVTADQGTLLHRYFDAILKNEEPAIPENEAWVAPVLDNFKVFAKASELKPHHIEKVLVSNTLGIGGTVDFIGEYKHDGYSETKWLLDWKTGGLHQSYCYQLAIYKFMAFENDLVTDDYGCGIAQFHRDGKQVGFRYVENVGEYLIGALHTFERWKLDNKPKLLWANAPKDVFEAYKKTRGKNREKFMRDNWEQSFMWPWITRDSIKDVRDYVYEKSERQKGLMSERKI